MGTATLSFAESPSVTPADAAQDKRVDGIKQGKSIRIVLLATDLTAASQIATEQAIDLAASIGAKLLVVNVIDLGERAAHSVAPFGSTRVDQQRASREVPLLAIIDRARMRGVEAA